jgi:beta-lactamase regulating signal transducer with metallopeptidase domain
MNASILHIDPSLAITLTIQVTVVLALALAAARWPARRNAATRHATLVCVLLIIAAAPIWAWASNSMQWSRQTTLPVEQFVRFSIDRPVPRMPAYNVAEGTPAHMTFLIADSLLTIWASGCAVLLVRLVSGLVTCSRIVRGTTQFHADRPYDCPIRISDKIAGPMCIGVFRPTVLLPAALLDELNPSQLRQVLDHECAHVSAHDHLIVLLQRLVAAVWWFHPLVHLTNRALDRAREERCDNHVVARGHDRIEYARTLLRIADWMTNRAASSRSAPGGGIALGLFQWNLERRVKELVDERRNLMTRASLPVVLTTAAILAGCATLISGQSSVARADAPPATAPAPAQLSIPLRAIPFELGEAEFEAGDSVTIEQVFCSNEKLATGEIFVVRGTYTLTSRDAAEVALFITAPSPQGTPISPHQRARIAKGTGRFELRTTFTNGSPHVSFYPAGGGSGFGGVYFGQGEFVLKSKGWSYKSGPTGGATDSIGGNPKR